MTAGGLRSAPSPFPEPLRLFVELFNREEFWASHEVLEHPWRESRSEFYHGLILYASAFVHVQRGNRRGVVAQLRKTKNALRPYPPDYLGVDVARIVREADQLRRRLESNGEAAERWTDRVQFPRIRLDPRRILGSEVEATAG